MKNLYFEELDKVEELGDFADFCAAAAPFIAMGLAAAIAIAT
ncbi:MAG: hypothetical protein N2489_04595 [Clostridia bacterium]|nr:hypothetical protein [Clostridia bacterium]